MHIKGAFFYSANQMPTKIAYSKTWLSTREQIEKLKKRGLVVEDEEKAADFLGHLNYYCFSGYGLAFESPRHSYLSKTTFEQIRHAYEFDRALRDLFTESIELIELDLRNTLTHEFSEIYGPFGHANSSIFYDQARHGTWLEKLREETQRSSDLFIQHYRDKYLEFPDIPIWVAAEIMSFGSLSTFYRCMDKREQKRVCARYGMQPQTLGSWIHHLVYVRNLCAHHARLWDRVWAIKPNLPPGKAWSPPRLASNGRLASSMLVQWAIIRNISAERTFALSWRERIEHLIDTRCPTCPDPLSKMGLSADWKKHEVWCF